MKRPAIIVAIAAAAGIAALWSWWPVPDSVKASVPRAPAGKAGGREAGAAQEAGFARVAEAGAVTLPPVIAKARLHDWQSGALRDSLMSVLLPWAEANPEEAARWSQQLPEEVRVAIQQEIAGAIMASSPRHALQLLAALPPGELTDQMLRQAAMEFATAHPADTLTWARAQPDAESRALILGAVLCAQAAHHPAEAAAAAAELPDNRQSDIVLVEIVQRWAQLDAPAAGVFVAAMSGEAAAPAAENLVANWATHDRTASARWAAGLTPGAAKDAAEAAWLRVTADATAAADAE